MQSDFQLIQFPRAPIVSEADAERVASAAQPDREAMAMSCATRRARRDHASVRNEVMGNDAGWYRAR